jgi:methionyl-tRNA synthetase
MPKTKAASEQHKVEKKKTWTTRLAHPGYVVEPCPNCEFPEADGGFCEECGWQRYEPTCSHCR